MNFDWMNISNLVLNWIFNWIIFGPNSMFDWIIETYRTGLMTLCQRAEWKWKSCLPEQLCMKHWNIATLEYKDPMSKLRRTSSMLQQFSLHSVARPNQQSMSAIWKVTKQFWYPQSGPKNNHKTPTTAKTVNGHLAFTTYGRPSQRLCLNLFRASQVGWGYKE